MIDRIFRFFENRIDPYPKADGGVPPGRFLAFIWHYVRPIWPYLAIFASLSAVVAVLEVVVFGFFGDLVDWLSSGNRETFLADNAWPLLGMGLVVLVVAPVVHILWELIFHQAFFGTLPMRIRWQAHRNLLRQSLSFFTNDMAGRISNTMMQTALAVRDTITRVLDILVYALVYFVGAAVLLADASWQLAMPLVLWLIGYLAAVRYFIPRMQRISMAQAEARSVMTGRIVDSYTNILTVKLFAHAAAEDAYARDSMDVFMVTVRSQMRLVTLLNTSLYALNFLLLFGVTALSIHLWSAGTVTTGDIAIAVAVVMRLQSMSQWILWEISGLFESIGTVQDGVKTLSKPTEVLDRADAPKLTTAEGGIRFEDVSFRYGAQREVLAGLDLFIKPHERVGLVGPSGAGKSTLVNALLRLYDLDGGRILIDGQDIATIGQESLRAAVGVVTQDTALLHRSVADNIRYGRPDATDEEVVAAAKRAEAHDFILELEDGKGRRGYEAHVGERGVKLSGGQRQRVAIARVLLKNAPILILDEATSALDSEIEAAIQESLSVLMEGKTVIAIAHRLSTIARMDRLVVLDRGRIVESGTHAELIGAGGLYARLWARQTGGFIDAGAEAEAAE
jgi:ATP-binding cassette subfamily B multidrug efflux pump